LVNLEARFTNLWSSSRGAPRNSNSPLIWFMVNPRFRFTFYSGESYETGSLDSENTFSWIVQIPITSQKYICQRKLTSGTCHASRVEERRRRTPSR
jgi:hypothetical protein